MLFEIERMSHVPFPAMNEVHSEELEMVNAIHDYLTSTKNYDHEKIEEMLKVFAFHLQEHFAFEEDMMRKTSCPVIHCHSGEHARVLRIMHQMFEDYALKRDVNLLKFYFEFEFKNWIENHIVTMDMVTGHFLSQRIAVED